MHQKLDQLDERVCKLIHQVADKTLPNAETPYHRIAAWVDAVRRENPIEVFTTNYDLLMEQAFEDCRVPYFDGFAGVRNRSLIFGRWKRTCFLLAGHGFGSCMAPSIGIRLPTRGYFAERPQTMAT